MGLFGEGEEMEGDPPTCVNPQHPEPSQAKGLHWEGLALQAEKCIVLKTKGGALIPSLDSIHAPLCFVLQDAAFATKSSNETKGLPGLGKSRSSWPTMMTPGRRKTLLKEIMVI